MKNAFFRISLIGVGVLACAAHAQNRVTTRWVLPVDGSFLDASAWSGGVPDNTSSTMYDVVIDALGGPYTVFFDPERFSDSIFRVQTLTLNSADATLSLQNRDQGTLIIKELLTINSGVLILGDAGLVASPTHVPILLSGDTVVKLSGSGVSQRNATLQGFDVYGGDLILEGSFPLKFYGSRMMGGDIIIRPGQFNSTLFVNQPIDYNITIEKSTDFPSQITTSVHGLVIEKQVTISGNAIFMLAENGFINYGTIRLEGGASQIGQMTNFGMILSVGGQIQIEHMNNFGLIHAAGGDLNYSGTNEGTLLASEHARLAVVLSSFGPAENNVNLGLIEVNGPGAIFEIGSGGGLVGEDLWKNKGTLSISDFGTARIGSTTLSDLGIIERDATSRIEIVGQLNLQGGLLNQHTFNGAVVVKRSDYVFANGGGFITNGTIDVSGDWLSFEGFYGAMSELTVVGGDFVIEPPVPTGGGGVPFRVRAQNIDVVDGGIVLSQGATISFQYIAGPVFELFTNEDFSTPSRFGLQGQIGVEGGNLLVLGPDSSVTGHLRLGIGSMTTRRLRNEGLIVSNFQTGSLDVDAVMENIGEVRSFFNTMDLFDVTNTGLLHAWWGGLNFRQLTNAGEIILKEHGTISASSNIVLTADSVLHVTVPADSGTILDGGFELTLGGEIELDLRLLSEPGVFQLYRANSIQGQFADVRVLGLDPKLEFHGIEPDGTFRIEYVLKLSPRPPRSR